MGTIFVEPDIITDSDPTTFTSLTFNGQGVRNMFDRRIDDFEDYTKQNLRKL